ncbi:hypothetical protein [Desulfonatronum thioautotrophicum]|uniref:hypothetical protein n=1 Tax=Desulfonatronum thioautotrophicum TaxID=617001 RepID=UPI00069ACEE3|nr:hypothetical protein [Desulfonatronum thioautotrophicum]
MLIRFSAAIVLPLLLLILGACAPRPAGTPLPPQATLAVAGFHQPLHGWQMVTGTRAGESVILTAEQLEELDGMLAELLRGEEGRPFLGPEATRQCQELVLARVGWERAGVSGLRYWMDVGQCVQTDYLLIPQVLEWREREGGEWGVTEPGRVVLELTLLDIENQFVVRRFQYDEQQRSLSEDLLQAGRFFRRGGRWLPAKELARDGLEIGLREMGL